jgi:hypothetical protein
MLILINLLILGIQIVETTPRGADTGTGTGSSLTGSIVAARFRRLFLLEKMQWYEEALQELDGLEQLAREDIQVWSDKYPETVICGQYFW